MDLIYTDAIEFTSHSWERVVHSLLTYCDTIWINENTIFSSQIQNQLLERYVSTFNELKEAGVIKLWAYEQSVLIESSLGAIIPKFESSILYETINHQIRDYAAPKTIGPKDTSGYELTSKIIQFKHELWNIGIANILGVDGICYPREEDMINGSFSDYYKYELINRKYTESLFEKFEINFIGFLPAKDILEIRKKAGVLKNYLSKSLKNKLLEIPPPHYIIENECSALFENCQKELNALIKEKSLKVFGIEFSKELVISSIGTILPIASLYPFGEKIVNFFMNKKKYGFLFFALDIKKRAQVARQSTDKFHLE